jgi:hypothetical protein
MDKMMTFESFSKHQIYDDERMGKGNSLKISDYGITILPSTEITDEMIDINDSCLGKYWYDTQEAMDYYEKEKISKDTPLYTNQEWVSGTFISDMTDDVYGEGDIKIAEDEKGRLWVQDGHHRLIYDRMNGRDSMAYVIPHEDFDEIRWMFGYVPEDGEEDED